MRVNCDQEGEFCREFLVYKTKLQIFPSFSGLDSHEFEYENYLDFLEENNHKKFLAYLTKDMINSVEDFVTYINDRTLKKFEKQKKPKIVLVTDKKKTPLLWKVLSKEFRNYINFGIVKSSSGNIYKSLNVKEPPMIIGFNKNLLLGEKYTDVIKPVNIRAFVRKIIANEHRESVFENVYGEIGFHC